MCLVCPGISDIMGAFYFNMYIFRKCIFNKNILPNYSRHDDMFKVVYLHYLWTSKNLNFIYIFNICLCLLHNRGNCDNLNHCSTSQS